MKRRRGRREKALCWLAAAAGLWLLCLAVSSPVWAVREQARRLGRGDVEVVAELGELALDGRKGRLYLAANEDDVMLCAAQFRLPLGWEGRMVLPLACREGETVHGSYWMVGGTEEEEALCYFFGRVDDPAVRQVEMVYYGAEGTEALAVSRRGEWHRWGGYDYFLAEVSREPGREAERYYLYADGRPVCEIKEWLSDGL